MEGEKCTSFLKCIFEVLEKNKQKKMYIREIENEAG